MLTVRAPGFDIKYIYAQTQANTAARNVEGEAARRPLPTLGHGWPFVRLAVVLCCGRLLTGPQGRSLPIIQQYFLPTNLRPLAKLSSSPAAGDGRLNSICRSGQTTAHARLPALSAGEMSPCHGEGENERAKIA